MSRGGNVSPELSAVEREWGVAPNVFDAPELCASLPSWTDLLRVPLLRSPFITVLRNNNELRSSDYSTSYQFDSRAKTELLLDQGDINLLLIDQSVSIKFNRVEIWSEAVRTVAPQMSATFGRTVEVYGFLSGLKDQMVPQHRDPAHVIAFQLSGTKRWMLGGAPPASPWSAMSEVDASDTIQFDLGPGLALYMPYGHAHRAVATSQRSFHLAFALSGVTTGELEHRVLEQILRFLPGSDSSELTGDSLEHELGRIAQTIRQAVSILDLLGPNDALAIESGLTKSTLDALFDCVRQQQRDSCPQPNLTAKDLND